MSSTISRRRFLVFAGGGATLTLGAMATLGRSPSVSAALTTVVASPVPAQPESQLVLRLEITGGFVPAEYTLTEIPAFSMYADGSVITTGPMIEIYPQPALPNLRRLRLTEAGMQTVLDRAGEAGLLAGDRSFENPVIADAPFAIFTSVVDGQVSTVSAYALGYGEETLPDSVDKQARAKLLEFQSFIFDLAGNLPAEAIAEADASYDIERIRIFSRPIDAANPPWEPEMEQEPMAWPLETPLAKFGDATGQPDLFGDMRCGVAIEDGAAELLTALQAANQLTPWESDGMLYQLWVRPLLPDENGC